MSGAVQRRLKLVTNAARELAQPHTRPFETDYAGAFRGHCKTREGAILAAMRHVLSDGYSRATVTDKRTGLVVARVSLSKDRKRVEVVTERAVKNG